MRVEQIHKICVDPESMPFDPERFLGAKIDIVVEVVLLCAARLEKNLLPAIRR